MRYYMATFWRGLRSFCQDFRRFDSIDKREARIKRGFPDGKNGVLQSYITHANAHDPKITAFYTEVASLTQMNTVIQSRVEIYGPSSITDEFRTQSQLYLKYVEVYGDRFKVLPDLVAKGAQLPNGGGSFPEAFPQAVKGEIAAREGMTKTPIPPLDYFINYVTSFVGGKSASCDPTKQ
jgi:hypothetical protein